MQITNNFPNPDVSFPLLPELTKHILDFSLLFERTCQHILSFSCTNSHNNKFVNEFLGIDWMNRIIHVHRLNSNTLPSHLFSLQEILFNANRRPLIHNILFIYLCTKKCNDRDIDCKPANSFLNQFNSFINSINWQEMRKFLSWIHQTEQILISEGRPQCLNIPNETLFEWKLFAKKIQFIFDFENYNQYNGQYNIIVNFIKFIQRHTSQELFASNMQSLITHTIALAVEDIDDPRIEDVLEILALYSDCSSYKKFSQENHTLIKVFLTQILLDENTCSSFKANAVNIAYNTFDAEYPIWQEFFMVSFLEEDDNEDLSIPQIYLVNRIHSVLLNEHDITKISKMLFHDNGTIVNIFIVIKEIIKIIKTGYLTDSLTLSMPQKLADIVKKLQEINLLTLTESNSNLMAELESLIPVPSVEEIPEDLDPS